MVRSLPRESAPMPTSLPVSIFNDVIGPVMRGPSSSHCAAALRIGRLCRDLLAGDVREVLLEFDRGGSLPTTHESQGSDMGLFGGLMGWDASDDRLPEAARYLREAGIRVQFATIDAHDPHPNTYRLTISNLRQRHVVHAISTGGGMMEVTQLDDFRVSLFGDASTTLIWVGTNVGETREMGERIRRIPGVDEVRVHVSAGGRLIEVRGRDFLSREQLAAGYAGVSLGEICHLGPVLPVQTLRGMSVPFSTSEELLRYDAGRNIPLWQHAIAYECDRGQIAESEVLARMVEIIQILRRSISQGVQGTVFADRILPPQTPLFQQAITSGRLLPAGPLHRILLYVSALMEVKSSLGVIVAAPTAGACAALPAAVIAMAEEMGLDEVAMAHAMLAAGLVGVFIATRWTFAAEVGGCQAEGGSAACMAASALVVLAGGTLHQSVAAASMAMQNMLGLICDPIAGRVEVPCLGKNVMAASNALSCANLALAGFDAVIPLDEVIESARQVSQQMPRELRCTTLGGLAITPTAARLTEQLAQARGCATGCECG